MERGKQGRKEGRKEGRDGGKTYKSPVFVSKILNNGSKIYRVADKSLARPTCRCILFDGENISFDASLVIYINSTNIPPIMLINSIYEHQNLLVAVACFLPGRAKDLPAPL
jgi:hypothetical protein